MRFGFRTLLKQNKDAVIQNTEKSNFKTVASFMFPFLCVSLSISFYLGFANYANYFDMKWRQRERKVKHKRHDFIGYAQLFPTAFEG